MSQEVNQLMQNFRGRRAALRENEDPVHTTSSLVAPTLVPFSINGAGYFDSTNAMSVFVYLPTRMFAITEARIMLNFREFFAPASSVASGGASTSGSGGSSTPTSSAGGSATPTSSSGGSATPTSSSSGTHSHAWATKISNVAAGYSLREHTDAEGIVGVDLYTDGSAALYTTNSGTAHTHSVTISGHTHTVTIGNHTHTVTIAAHDHTTPDHTHSLAYGVYKEAYPASHSVDVNLYQYSAGWVLANTFSGITADQSEVDMTDYLNATGKWRIDIISQPAQPNDGRLGCDVSGFVLGAVQGA